jgi:regulatory protein
MARQPFPGTITAIEAQAKTRRHLGQRVNVFVDGRFSFALDAALAMQYDLHPGYTIDGAQLEELLRADGDARAYARALHFLSYRLRSATEIRDRLKRDEWPDAVIDRVLQRLQEEKLVDDAGFAAAWVENRSVLRPRGARALRQELRQKGVEREAIDEALPDAEQEIENAVEAARRKLHTWSRLEERDRREKMLAFLQRRGFNYSTARAALKQIKEDSS